MNRIRNIITLLCVIGVLSVLQGCFITNNRMAMNADNRDVIGSKEPYFTPSTSEPKVPDNDGFLRRWLLLEPINKPNRTNTVFTDSYLREAFYTEYFPNQFTVIP